jgi:voltage-gated potassium channel
MPDNYMRRNFFTIFFSLLILLGLGMSGYVFIEGWGWLDALYMTFIAFSTVGFEEVRSLGLYGRIFTMFIILFGLILLSMMSASVTSLLVRHELLPDFKQRKLKKMIASMERHTILCGAGETGRTVIKEFVQARKPLVVIEKDEEILEELRESYPSLPIIEGDATKDEELLAANIEKAGGLIAALREDTDNLFVVISARSLNPHLVIVTRAVDVHAESKMYKAGATHVISPNLTEGSRMAAMVLRPTVVSFLDVMMHDEETAFRLEEIAVPEGSSFHGKTLKEVEIPQRTGLIVIAMEKQTASGPAVHYNPQSTTVIHAKDKLIVLGDFERIDKLDKLLQV